MLIIGNVKTLPATVILPARSNLSANCNGTPPLHRRLTGKEIKLEQSIYPRVYSCIYNIDWCSHQPRGLVVWTRSCLLSTGYSYAGISLGSIVFVNLVLSVKADKDLVWINFLGLYMFSGEEFKPISGPNLGNGVRRHRLDVKHGFNKISFKLER